MQLSCSNCLHLKKWSDKMYVFCDMNRLGKFIKISTNEVKENGAIEFYRRRLFRSAFTCPAFVSMEDDEEKHVQSLGLTCSYSER